MKPYYRSTLTSPDGATIQDFFTQDCDTAEQALELFEGEAQRDGKSGQFSKPIDLNLVETRTATAPQPQVKELRHYTRNSDGSLEVRE